MELIGVSKIWSFVEGSSVAKPVTNGAIRRDPGFLVANYLELASRVAELQYLNRNHVLLFRGQHADWLSTKSLSTLKATLFRPLPGKRLLSSTHISKRFEALALAETRLAEGYNRLRRFGRQRMDRERVLRWSVIQHYEVCPTPLLDVTHSLRIAASFASLDAGREAYLYVLAVPNLSGAVTANAESGVQVVRLSSVCPPVAIRPHIQEGYLLGEYPEMVGPVQKDLYKGFELDFGRRIVGKFRFNPQNFWSDDDFPQVPKGALYPIGKDWLEHLTSEISAEVTPLLPV